MNYYDKEALATETKEILEYFFLEQSKSFIENSSRKQQKFSSKKSFDKLLISKQKYVDRVWDENHTIVNYLLSHKDFKLSNAKINELYKITDDWSSPNDAGENSLFFLIKREYDIKQILQLIERLDINYHQKNLDNLYFINYFFKEDNIEKIITDFEKGINNFPEIRLNKYFESYLSVIDNFPQLFKETVTLEKQKYNATRNKILSYDFKEFNNNQIGINLKNTFDKLDKTFMFIELDNKLKEKNMTGKRIKI